MGTAVVIKKEKEKASGKYAAEHVLGSCNILLLRAWRIWTLTLRIDRRNKYCKNRNNMVRRPLININRNDLLAGPSVIARGTREDTITPLSPFHRFNIPPINVQSRIRRRLPGRYFARTSEHYTRHASFRARH